MASADEYAAWIVKNAAKRGTPEFDTVAQAYELAKQEDVSVPRKTSSLVDQIPGSRVKAPPAPEAPPKRYGGPLPEALMAPIETAVALGTGLVSAPIVEASKIGGTLFSGKYGTQEGIRAGEAVGRKVQEFFQPAISPTAQGQVESISNALASTGLQGVPLNVLGDLQRGLTPALRATADTARAPIAARAEKIQQARVEQSYANAPMIEATQAAQRIGGAVPPAISNPTKANVIKGKLVGPELETQLAKNNEAAVTEKVRKDLGIKPNEKLIPEVDEATGKLNIDSPITRAVEEASTPYEVIRKMEALTTPKESIDALTALKRADTIGGDTKVAAINGLIDDAVTKLQQTTSGAFSGVGGGPVAVGRSGAAVLDDVRSLRRDAQATYRAQKINPDPLASAKADTQMAIANILEDIIDANAPTPKVLRELREARTRIAQIYEHERAINYGQQKIDPQVYAKIYEERKGGMTGLNADIAKAASMFPDYFTLTPAEIKALPRITRGGVGAAIGAVLGSPLGPAGALAGTAAGMGVGGVASSVAARRMATPAYQRANAMPTDYRPVPLGANPADINYAPNQMVPYNFAQETFTPPNFVFGRSEAQVTPSAPNMMNALPAPTPGGPINALRAEDVRRAQMSRTLGQQAEAQQAAAEAAARQPTRGGAILEVDPVTGKVTIGAEGGRNITPATQVIESTGKSLQSAANLLASGKSPALMTAEQKIAWEKTKVDLAEVMPGMKALNDKAIAAKMQDRAWVQQSLDKAQQQAQAFQDIAARATNERLRQTAIMKREQMLDLAEQLQDALGARPVSRGGQGPKTRNFQRNMLAPEQEVQNALSERAVKIDLKGMANK